jgi:hypothetical protein
MSIETKLINVIEKTVPKTVKEIESVLKRPYWSGINVGEAFESIFAGMSNKLEFECIHEGKKGGLVDIYYKLPAILQIKTTHPDTLKVKGYFQFCRCKSKDFDSAISETRQKFIEAFDQYKSKEFYLMYHNFKAQTTNLYLLASKANNKVTFHKEFLSGNSGFMSKDYLNVSKSNLELVWSKNWSVLNGKARKERS